MVNILIPTDFSDMSKVAVKYAVQFANRTEATITLLHVVNLIQPSRASIRLRLRAVEQELMDVANEDMILLVEEFTGQLKSGEFRTRIIKGSSFNEAVKKEAKKLRSGLIIMGTRGASGLRKYVVGTNTASVIEVSHIPVLVIPELAKFKNLRNVVYATDLKHTEKELKTLIPYLQKMESVVHLIHVTSSQKQLPALEKKIDSVVVKLGFKNVIARVLFDESIDDAINKYVTTVKADMLTTFTHDHGFYDKLFNRSLTRKIAFQSKIPLLAFRQK